MTNLEQQHFNAIQPILLKGLRFTQDAAKASEAITIEQMKGFAEWIDKKGFLKMSRRDSWIIGTGEIVSMDGLIEIYLKTLS